MEEKTALALHSWHGAQEHGLRESQVLISAVPLVPMCPWAEHATALSLFPQLLKKIIITSSDGFLLSAKRCHFAIRPFRLAQIWVITQLKWGQCKWLSTTGGKSVKLNLEQVPTHHVMRVTCVRWRSVMRINESVIKKRFGILEWMALLKVGVGLAFTNCSYIKAL